MRCISKKILTIICAVALIASIGGSIAAYSLMSNVVTITTVLPEPTALTLVASATTVTVGSTITFTATLNQPIAGVSITLIRDDVSQASATTNANGVATFQVQVPQAVDSFDYWATA